MGARARVHCLGAAPAAEETRHRARQPSRLRPAAQALCQKNPPLKWEYLGNRFVLQCTNFMLITHCISYWTLVLLSPLMKQIRKYVLQRPKCISLFLPMACATLVWRLGNQKAITQSITSYLLNLLKCRTLTVLKLKDVHQVLSKI